ncbi:helix-turn-helix domain-containing protein [Geothermobacter hydrogeniphilus]|uniref:XRE family transcriptional regulator n=1 Tax=Geothermobacter hydrogeniphilus TaxID=1969733 RepID=A0A1X0XLB3_9BACT|nr:XRE family transcriptional regulator [Geothermobacter hydrogeniphilus]ORJ53685.1 XRE family transcriptional regulator [Geothermobacter hydrogeniphilus]
MVKKLIGKKLKATRLKNDMTIQELAEASRVSSNMISRIERGLTIPSVEILMKLAGAFGMSINYFVEEAERGSTIVHTRKGQGEPIFFFEDKHQITSLTQGLRDPGFAVFYDTLEEGCDSGQGGMVHTGEEFALVLQGRMEFFIEEQRYLLEEGDSIVFKASLPHRWVNLHTGRTLVMWVVSPPPDVTQPSAETVQASAE